MVEGGGRPGHGMTGASRTGASRTGAYLPPGSQQVSVILQWSRCLTEGAASGLRLTLGRKTSGTVPSMWSAVTLANGLTASQASRMTLSSHSLKLIGA